MPSEPLQHTITRFAPSPTGLLHLGNAYSALYTHNAAKRAGGTFLLRIEDIDVARCRPELADTIIEDLHWLGLTWPTPVRYQSEHLGDYEAALHQLNELGVTYPCFCTRKQIAAEIARSPSAPHGPDGALYPGTCRELSPDVRASRIAGGESFAIRLDVAKAVAQVGHDLRWHDRHAGWQPLQPGLNGDVVLARKDIRTSYHLSVTVDDALQDITLVTRGVDLFAATHVHRLLQALLGMPTPAYDHHSLIHDDDGQRMTKRNQAQTIRELRENGIAAADVRRDLGFD